MKIIDILNKMANGTLEDGFKFNYDNDTYCYNKEKYEIVSINYGACLGNYYKLEGILDDEVEAIEENKEIEELNKISYDEFKYTDNKHRFDLTNIEYDKINELVRAVNKLSKEREEK